ncbi:MAG: ATP-binding protein [Planctomycetota bacterium]
MQPGPDGARVASVNLILTSEVLGDQVISLGIRPIMIGRAAECDIRLIDRMVSSQHALIRRADRGYEIRDCGSTNGTFVNGARVQSARLLIGDEITIGHTLLIFTDKKAFEGTARMVVPSVEPISGLHAPVDAAPSSSETTTSGLFQLDVGEIEKRFFRDIESQGSPDLRGRLEVVYRMGAELNQLLSVDRLLERVSDLVIELIECDRVFVIVREGPRLVPKVVRRREGLADHPGLSLSATILKEVVRHGKAVLARDAQEDARFRGGDSIHLFSIQSALAVPMRVKESILGIIYVDKISINRKFNEDDMKLLALVANQAAPCLANARAVEELRQTNQELRSAKEQILRWNLELEAKVQSRTREIEEKTDEILRLSQEKDELLGMVAHDLRTPLTGIVGYSQVLVQHLEMGSPPETVMEEVETVKRIALDMAGLLNDLLDVSRIEAGRINILKDALPLERTVAGCTQNYRALGQVKSIKVEFVVEPGLPRVPHDPRRVAQVVNNLLSNALKFTPPGGDVRVSVLRDERPGWVRVVVEDTGRGISPGDLQRIFERFERGPSGPRGAGLGLTIARKLVELHGGEIWVESAHGAGSRFMFALPGVA